MLWVDLTEEDITRFGREEVIGKLKEFRRNKEDYEIIIRLP
jgi:hypothetical protein